MSLAQSIGIRGLIPARAGKTTQIDGMRGARTVDPRARGEDIRRRSSDAVTAG